MMMFQLSGSNIIGWTKDLLIKIDEIRNGGRESDSVEPGFKFEVVRVY